MYAKNILSGVTRTKIAQEENRRSLILSFRILLKKEIFGKYGYNVIYLLEYVICLIFTYKNIFMGLLKVKTCTDSSRFSFWSLIIQLLFHP